ncbi:MAG: hypothetical protein ACHQE5_00860 [Actinomycetes bacterium]
MSAQLVRTGPDGAGGAGPQHSRPRLVVAVVVLAVVAVAAFVVGLRLPAYRSAGPAAGPVAAPSASVPAPASVTPTPSPTPTPSLVVPVFPYAPLWPFRGVFDAAAWQASYRATGAQPWHLDPAQTALTFTRDFLGYREIDRVVGAIERSGREAWVPVGAAPPSGPAHAAAILHLARIGAAPDPPWEVVGSRDTTLTLTSPRYGAAVVSPVIVGGRITGVDENLQVQVRTLSGLAGRAANIPAGGLRTPWSATVAFSASSGTVSSGTVLTVAVSTGGHVRAVERFAITGLRVA